MAFISVSIGPSAGSSAHVCVERAIAATVVARYRWTWLHSLFYAPYEGTAEEVNIIGRIRWFAREI